jgi:hypothetical protein
MNLYTECIHFLIMDEGQNHQLLPQSIQEDVNLLLQYKRTCEKRWKLEKKLRDNRDEFEHLEYIGMIFEEQCGTGVSCGGHNCREESEKYEDTMFELVEEEEDINIELGVAVGQCEMVKNRIHPPLSDVVTRIDSNFVVGDDDFYRSRYVLC